MNGLEMVQALIARGYQPHQAAALAGHFLQESGGNPSALNEKEGAFGISQWRLDRRANLENFAKARGTDPSDINTQLDFVGHELNGPEKKAGTTFLSAPDLPSASAALKGVIRYGDNSDAVRLANAKGLYEQAMAAPVGALAGPARASAGVTAAPGAPAPPSGAGGMVTAAGPAAASAAAPVGVLASAPGIGAGMQQLGKQLGAGQQVDFLPEQQIQMARPDTGQSAQIAAALAKAYGFGG